MTSILRWTGLAGLAALVAAGGATGAPVATLDGMLMGQALAAVAPATQTTVLSVEGMTWPVGWPPKVKAALVKVAGFKSVNVDFARKEAKVTYDPSRTTPEKLAAAVRKGTGFKVKVKG